MSDKWSQRIVRVGNYRVFVWSGWRVERWRGFEYWDRLCLGWIYVLRYRHWVSVWE